MTCTSVGAGLYSFAFANVSITSALSCSQFVYGAYDGSDPASR